MASQNDQQYALQDQERRDLNHRLFLDDQQRRINHRNMLEASYRKPICPYYSLSGHAACSTCYQNALSHQDAPTQSSGSMGDLLRSLSRPQSQTAPTGRMETPYLPSPVSIEHTLTQHLSQLITPRSTAPTGTLANHGLPNQEPFRKLASSKPRAPAPNPTQATPVSLLNALTQPRPAPLPPLAWTELPIEKDFVPVTIPPTFSHFLYLPILIRNRIYAYSVVNGDHGLLISKDLRAYHQAPITRVNRQIRSESLLMVYTENAFDAKNRELVKVGPVFARHLGDAKLRLIRRWAWFTAKRHLFIDFPEGKSYHTTYRGPEKNDEIKAVAYERATEVHNYLRKHVSPHGLSYDNIVRITEVVLRITPKVKAKDEEKSTQKEEA
ncbi:hypothetical protein E4T44_11865 [Aureobasidium sp. EXF-8845]|nr:hypothetical protein E4T44_11865 [Aureobasidium sp. EXF-8845]